MRVLPVIFIGTVVALGVATAMIVSGHFGTRDWPTPPVPDTASRLVTPTEAAGRLGHGLASHPQRERTIRLAGEPRVRTAAVRPSALSANPRPATSRSAGREAGLRSAPATQPGTSQGNDPATPQPADPVTDTPQPAGNGSGNAGGNGEVSPARDPDGHDQPPAPEPEPGSGSGAQPDLAPVRNLLGLLP